MKEKSVQIIKNNVQNQEKNVQNIKIKVQIIKNSVQALIIKNTPFKSLHRYKTPQALINKGVASVADWFFKSLHKNSKPLHRYKCAVLDGFRFALSIMTAEITADSPTTGKMCYNETQVNKSQD